MTKLVIALLFVIVLFAVGCLQYDVRQELPTQITVETTQPTVPESPIECKEAACMAMVKESEKKNVKWDCSPTYKGANDDPRGTVYYKDQGDNCKQLRTPDTLCLKYDCSFDTQNKVGYYYAAFSCKKGGSGYGIAYPSETLTRGEYYEGLGSMGAFKSSELADTDYMGCNAVSSLQRRSGYNLTCEGQEGCYTCDQGGTLVSLVPYSCPANMPIEYPYNAKGFEYNPILNTSSNPPDSKLINNLADDYVLLGQQVSEYLNNTGGDTSENYVKGCENICKEAKRDPAKSEECNKCSREHANDDVEDFSASDRGITVRGFSYNDLQLNKCNGLTPCVEIDRAGVGIGKDEILTEGPVGWIKQRTCGQDEYSGVDEQRYFICKCKCEVALYSMYECTRGGQQDKKYYYSYCKQTSDKTSQGGYVYSLHNFSSGMYKQVLSSENLEIPVFMIGQGPSFNDYELAKKLCKPSNPATVSINAGLLPFVPKDVSIFEGGQVCFKNNGGKDHTLYIAENGGDKTLLMTLEAGKGKCFLTGENTNFTLGVTKVTIDDNDIAYAQVNVIVPDEEVSSSLSEMKLDAAGNPTFYYKSIVELDPVYASGDYEAPQLIDELYLPGFSAAGTQNQQFSYSDNYIDTSQLSPGSSMEVSDGITLGVNLDGSLYLEGALSQEDDMEGNFDPGNSSLRKVLRVVEGDNVRILYAPGPGEYTSQIGGSEFSYVVYVSGDTITVRGSGEPLFDPAAISIPKDSKLCIRNEAPAGKKVLVLEKKLTYEPNTYIPVEAKSSYYGLECCFDIKQPGVYRISDRDYPASSKAYVVVFPTDVEAEVQVNDYDYSPYSSIAKKDDFICISNPVGEDRMIEYTSDEGYSGSFVLPSLQDYCTYDISSEEANYEFTDMVSGANFYISTTGGDVLNLDAYSTLFAPLDGRVAEGGKVCINAVDSDVYIKGPVLVTGPSSLEWSSPFLAQILNSSGSEDSGSSSQGVQQGISVLPYNQDIEGISTTGDLGELISLGQKKCYTMDSEGLYLFRNSLTGKYALVAVGDVNTLYIVNGQPAPGFAEVTFPDYSSVLENPLNLDIFTQFPIVKVVNLDSDEYRMYDELSVHNGTGFSLEVLDLSVPDVIIRNDADYDIYIKVLSSSSGERTFAVPSHNYVIYSYLVGDYKLTTDSVVYSQRDYDAGLVNLDVEISPRRMMSDTSLVISPGVNEYTVRRIGGIFLNYYKVGETISSLPNNMLVIRGDVEGSSASALGEIGAKDTIGFGVQLLSGKPSKTQLMQARSMLAYDNALPVFVYSRIGDTDVDLVDPTIPENYSISEGSMVNVTLAEGISMNDVSSPAEAGPYLSSINGWSFDMPDHDIYFEANVGSITKQFNLKSIGKVKEIKVSYDAYKLDDHGTDNYAVRIHNLAEDPRAIMLRPSDVSTNGYCMFINDGDSAQADLNTFWSPQKMTVYSLINNNIDDVSNHDPYVSEQVISLNPSVGRTGKITSITLLPNMGYDNIQLSLGRETSEGENIGSLVLRSNHTVIPNSYASKLNQKEIILSPGFLSGLKDTLAVREYRIYTSRAFENSDKTMRFSYIDLGADVYSGSYSVLLRRYAPGHVWQLSNSNAGGTFRDGLLPYWKGSLFVVKGMNVLPDKFEDLWFYRMYPSHDDPSKWRGWIKTGCSFVNDYGEKVGFIVPFNNEIYPKQFAYSFPHIIGVPPLSSATFDGGVDKYAYLHSNANDYVLLPQVVGNLYYGVGSVFPSGISGDQRDISLRDGYGMLNVSGVESVSVLPDKLIFSNGELVNDVALKFVDSPEQQKPCGRMLMDEQFILTGDRFGGYSENFDSYTCGPGHDNSELKIDAKGLLKNNNIGTELGWGDVDPDNDSMYVIVYNKYGTFCAYPQEDNVVGEGPNSYLMYWCRASNPAWGHESQLEGSPNDNWYLAMTHGGIGSYSYSDTDTSNVKFFDISEPYGNYNGVYPFINDNYYEFPETTCDSNPELPPGQVIKGGVSESALTNGILFMINSIDFGSTYFAPLETANGVSEFGQGYAVSDVFGLNSESGMKVACYGENTFDGIQDVISPLGTTTYYPDMQGWYTVYESPYYPNFVQVVDGKVSTFSHMSPFVRDLNEEQLGDLLYEVPSFSYGGRMYRNASLSGEYVSAHNLYADVYLYNLTMTGLVNASDPSTATVVNEVDVNLGDNLIINNTGPDQVVWYYGVLDPCSDDDIQGIIQNKLTQQCNGDYAECIGNPTQYSVSPLDMDNYLNTVSLTEGDKIKRITIDPNQYEIFDTADQLTVPSGSKSATYIFYNPYSGKTLTVNVYRPEISIELDVNSFMPHKVSIPNDDDSRLCITNRDDEERTIMLSSDSFTGDTTHTLSPGDRWCNNAQFIGTHTLTDEITGRPLQATVDDIGSSNQLSVIEQIAQSIAEPKMGADNPVYEMQLLNPRAPATPSIITSELIDIDRLSDITDEGYDGLADQIVTIEQVCRSVKSSKQNECNSSMPLEDTENIEHTYNYEDFSVDGCCCKTSESSECIPATKEACEQLGDDFMYTYLCPSQTTVYKQRCLSTIPFYIHLSHDEHNISYTDISNMKDAIQNIENKLKDKIGDNGQKADMVGYFLIIDDPGIARRGQCSISSYLEGLYNVSQYALTEYGMPSIILGFGINRNLNEEQSCWTNTELIKQVKGLYEQDINIMLGYGITGIGQYCLVDTSCKPLSTGVAGADYGLYYDTGTSGENPFTYGVDTAPIYPGLPSFSQYATSTIGASSSTSYYSEGGIESSFGSYSSAVSSYSDLLSSAGVSLPTVSAGSESNELSTVDSFNNVNDPNIILENTIRKDPYARHWFDMCGNYYYEGEGQALMVFSESNIPKGQQGNMCDRSRLMELYKKYKCE